MKRRSGDEKQVIMNAVKISPQSPPHPHIPFQKSFAAT
jgi:hypothetical protein